jgi:NADP-dependent 3-hydroxy acid dehydrogenase YdfG
VVDAAERPVSELGRVDTVVTNAGIMLIGPTQDTPTEAWD